jgi:hypothetical protein
MLMGMMIVMVMVCWTLLPVVAFPHPLMARLLLLMAPIGWLMMAMAVCYV